MQNAVRELSRHGSAPSESHIKAMYRVLEYCKETPKRGCTFKPKRKWDGKYRSFKFRIHGLADSDYAKCPTNRRSVSGYSAFLEGTEVSVKISMQRIVALSVTESELMAGV